MAIVSHRNGRRLPKNYQCQVEYLNGAMPCAYGSPRPARERRKVRVIEVVATAFRREPLTLVLSPFEGRGDKDHAKARTLLRQRTLANLCAIGDRHRMATDRDYVLGTHEE